MHLKGAGAHSYVHCCAPQRVERLLSLALPVAHGLPVLSRKHEGRLPELSFLLRQVSLPMRHIAHLNFADGQLAGRDPLNGGTNCEKCTESRSDRIPVNSDSGTERQVSLQEGCSLHCPGPAPLRRFCNCNVAGLFAYTKRWIVPGMQIISLRQGE